MMNIILDINKSRILRITKQPINGHDLLDSLISGNIVSTFSSSDDEKFDSEFVPVRRAYLAFLNLNIPNRVPGVDCAVSAECGSFQINFGLEGNPWPLPFSEARSVLWWGVIARLGAVSQQLTLVGLET